MTLAPPLLLALLLGAQVPVPDGGAEDAPPSEGAASDAGAPAAAAPAALDAGVAEKPAPPLVTAKYGEGITVQAGDFKLNLRGRIQVQALAVVPTEDSHAVRQNAFYVRRARLALKADLPYRVSLNLQLAFSVLDMEADAPNVLRDYNLVWAPLRDLSFRLGQMKVPFDIQRVVSSSSLQFVDRSTTTGEFNLDRDVGLVVFSDDLFGFGHRLRYALGVFGGDGRNRVGNNVGLLYVARVRLSPFGAFDDKLEGDPDRDSRFRVAVGVAAARNVATNRPRSTTGTPFKFATFSYNHATADLHLKWRGLSLLAEVYWRQADVEARPGTVNGVETTEWARSGWGAFAQAGYYLTDWLELVARYADSLPKEGTDPKFTRLREVGGGVNWMVRRHDLKLQTDVLWLDDGQGRDGRVQWRLQAQVFF